MTKKKWIKKDLMAKYPIGTPVAYLLGYPTSKPNHSFGVVTGYDKETYGSTWAITMTRCDGHETSVIPDQPANRYGCGRHTIITQATLKSLEAKFNQSKALA